MEPEPVLLIVDVDSDEDVEALLNKAKKKLAKKGYKAVVLPENQLNSDEESKKKHLTSRLKRLKKAAKVRKRQKIKGNDEDGCGCVGNGIQGVSRKISEDYDFDSDSGYNEQSFTTVDVSVNDKESHSARNENITEPVNEYDTHIPDSSCYYAMDCEFVGVHPNHQSALGRCSVVDFDGKVVCDIYAKPEQPISDYRTMWSGITPRHMKNAIPFENARNIVKRVLAGKIVVGHAVHNDFKVLAIDHPQHLIRDTSKNSELKSLAALRGFGLSLKSLAKNLLGRTIQQGSHCSVEDAQATMDVFQLVRENWEGDLKTTSISKRKRQTTEEDNEEDVKKKRRRGLKHGIAKETNKIRRTCSSVNLLNIASNSCTMRRTASTGNLRNLVVKNESEKSFLDDDFWPQDI